MGNLLYNANKAGEQNIMRSAGSQVGQLCDLVEETGERDQPIGTSAAIAAYGTRLHDIMGVAPAILALNGVVGNLAGFKLGIDAEFVPKDYRQGKREDWLKHIKQKGMVKDVPIGPVISAHNKNIYDKVRAFMLNDPENHC